MNKIKKYRDSFGWTQKILAEKLNTTQQTIAKWEKGDREPNLKALRDMAMLFGTSVDNLMSDFLESMSTRHDDYIHKANDNDIDGYWGYMGLSPILGEKKYGIQLQQCQKT